MSLKSFAFVIVIATLLACGGAGGNNGGTGGGGGTTEIPVEKRSAVIASIESKGMELAASGASIDDQNAQLADFMKSIPEFAKVAVTPEQNVFGRFTDGRLYIYINNRFPEWATRSAGQRPLPPRVETNANPVVTTSKQARLFHSFGLGFLQQQDPIGEMSGWLTAAGYKVNNPAEGDARLATLRTVSGDGFFYFNSHGFGLELTDTEKTYGAGSSTLRTDDNDKLPEIKDDLDNLRILYATAPNGESWSILGKTIPKVDTRYAITHRFVDRYWSFGQNAIVFMNTCWSGKTDVGSGAQAFMFSCFKKGAGAYLGWTHKVGTPISEEAPKYFVDRLTAANSFDPEDPEQRPFFVDEIVADMKANGYGNSGEAELVLKNRVATTTVGLRPTIESLIMGENIDELLLFGQFGPVPGQVFVGGVEATSVQWGEKQISCKIPRFGPGSYGEVMVKVHGKESNKRMLTLWTGPFTYNEVSQDVLKKTASGTIKFRADFAKIRKKPGVTPSRKDFVPFFLALDSTLTWQASGERRDDKGALIEKWSGGGSPPYRLEPIASATPVGAWCGNGAYNPVTGEVAIALVNGDAWTITDSTGSKSFPAFTGGMIKKINTTTWIIDKFDSGAGSPRWTFGPFLPSASPAGQLLGLP